MTTSANGNSNDTNVSLDSLFYKTEKIGRAALDEYSSSTSWAAFIKKWKPEFCAQIDEMVSSFLSFPACIPQDFRDKQFARHLLWRIGDSHRAFAMLYMQGKTPADFDFLWKRLMPYVTGDLPEYISTIDPRLMSFSIQMHKIVQDYVMLNDSCFDELMEQIIEVMRTVREM